MFKTGLSGKILIFVIATLYFLTNTPFAFSQKQFGDVTITFISGEVLILKKDTTQWLPAKPGDILSEGDAIKTLTGAKAELQFPSGSNVILNEETSLVIEQLALKARPTEERAEVFLIEGRIKAIIEKLDKGGQFEIKTPTAIAGVRGTIFYLNVVRESERIMTALPPGKVLSYYNLLDMLFGVKDCYAAVDGLITEILVEKGVVDFTNLISQISYKVGEGQGSFADEEGRIPEPTYVPPEKQKEWKSGFEPPKPGKEKKQEGKKEDKKGETTTPVTRKAEDSVVVTPASDTGAGEPAPAAGPEVVLPPAEGDPTTSIEGPGTEGEPNRDTGPVTTAVNIAVGETSTDVNINLGTEERQLKEELVDLYNDIEGITELITLATLDARLEEIQDAQEGKVMKDRDGHIVRSESYVLRPTSDKVAMLFLSHRRDGSHAGVSSVTFEVNFNTNLAGVDLKNDIPWSDIMSANGHDDPITYSSSSAPSYYPKSNNADFDPATEQAGMTLTMRNPHGDYNRIYDGFGALTEVTPGVWQQAHVNPLYDMNINGTFKDTGFGTGWVSAGGSGSFEPTTSYKMTGYVIDNDGNIQTSDIFTDGSSQNLQINSVRNMLKPKRQHNLEFTIEATEFDGRSIDAIVTPEIMRPYHKEE